MAKDPIVAVRDCLVEIDLLHAIAALALIRAAH